MRIRRNNAVGLSHSREESTQPTPLFTAPKLVDVLHPSSDERAALKAVSNDPPNVARNADEALQH